MARRFKIEDTITRQYRRLGATGRQLVVRLSPPSDNSNSVSNFFSQSERSISSRITESERKLHGRNNDTEP